jgi:hypothetical protein
MLVFRCSERVSVVATLYTRIRDVSAGFTVICYDFSQFLHAASELVSVQQLGPYGKRCLLPVALLLTPYDLYR